MGYQAAISRVEDSYKDNLFYINTTKQIRLLDSQ